jgi:hypothetical protein
MSFYLCLNLSPKTVDGKWADWSHWSECDVTCGNGKHTRVRTCTNPAPSNQGLECKGKKIDDKSCTRSSCPGNRYYIKTRKKQKNIRKEKH